MVCLDLARLCHPILMLSQCSDVPRGEAKSYVLQVLSSCVKPTFPLTSELFTVWRAGLEAQDPAKLSILPPLHSANWYGHPRQQMGSLD